MILGIDEVGRGPWAGPLVVGAVVLGDAVIKGLTDSKLLTKEQRERLNVEIRANAAGIGLGWVDNAEIDEIGLSEALVLATKQAVEQINVSYHEIIIDGTVNFLKGTNKGQYVTVIKKADLLIPCVSAASIIAKVARDNYMCSIDGDYPEFGFKNHVGYGTKKHIEAIKKLGVTPLHRLSYAPLQKYINDSPRCNNIRKTKPSTITTKQIGDKAENVAAKYLQASGHKIIYRNWKTKYCEIDIISKYKNTIYFSEVKYRKNANQGGGLDAITAKKLKQMKFAAEFYAQKNKIIDTDLRLAVISLSGQPLKIDNFLEI